jgi:hypothetical protein
VGVNGPFEEAVVVLRFLYSFNETDFFGVVEANGGGGDFLETLVGGESFADLSSDVGRDTLSSLFRFCPEVMFDKAKLAREADLSEGSNAPGSVGLRG